MARTHGGRWYRRVVKYGVLAAGLLAVAALGRPGHSLVAGLIDDLSPAPAPTVTTDQVDYAAGSVVTITGANWPADDTVTVFVNDSAGQTWSETDYVTADANGAFADQVTLPNWFVATYTVTASDSSGNTATTSFTDSALNILGTDGSVHDTNAHSSHTPEDLSSDISGTTLTVASGTTTRGANTVCLGLTLDATGLGSNNVTWSLGYGSSPAGADNSTLGPLTTFSPTPATGTFTNSSNSRCQGFSINVASLTPGATYNGSFALVKTSGTASPSEGDYYFKFTMPSVVASSTTVACSPGSIPWGGKTVCTATVSGGTTPTGTVDTWASTGSGTFYVHNSGTVLPTGGCTLTSGACSVDFVPAAGSEGTRTVSAKYEGDAGHAASTSSSTDNLTVTAHDTGTTVACSPDSVTWGTTTVCTATVTDSTDGTQTPTGSVGSWSANGAAGTFYEHGSSTPLGTGTCDLSAGACSVDFVPAKGSEGSVTIGASYVASTDWNASDSSSTDNLTVTAHGTSTAVACVPSSVAWGSTTVCTATVTDSTDGTQTPTGSVGSWSANGAAGTFYQHGSNTALGSGTCSLSGGACSVDFVPASGSEGVQTISASYVASTDWTASSSSTTAGNLTVTKQTIHVYVSGTQTYGGGPSFTYTDDAPGGVTLGSTLTCTKITAGGGTTITSSLIPGSYTLDGSTCSGLTVSDPANYQLSYSGVTNKFVVSKKTATLGFTGNLFWSTGSATATSANVTFTGLVTPATGGTVDLTKATVVFLVYKSSNLTMASPDYTCGAPSGVAANASGVVTCGPISLPVDNYTVIMQIPASNAYFTAPDSDPVVLTVYQPTTDLFATGGGWIVDPSYKNIPVAISPTNNHGNFGFSVKYKSGTNPMGQSVYVFRGADGYDYVVKSNSWTGGGLSFGPSTASFSGKCNVTVMNPATGQAVSGLGGGNFTYRVDVTQGTSTTPDTYAISVYTPTGVLYHQAGTTGGQLPLGGGHIVVHNTAH